MYKLDSGFTVYIYIVCNLHVHICGLLYLESHFFFFVVNCTDYPNHEWIPVGNSSVNKDKKNPKYWQTIRGRKTRAGNRSTKPAKKRPKSQTTVGHQVRF